MIIGTVQFNVNKYNKQNNLARVVDLIGDTRVDLVVLPELFSTGYFFENREQLAGIAENVPEGPTTAKMMEIAAQKKCHIVGTIVENDNNKLYITAVVVGPNKYIGKQRKRHLTRYELQFYVPGDKSDIFDINGCKVGVVICLEGWFPESVRELTMKGAQVICHSALTANPITLEIMRVRAIENKAFLVLSNSISTEIFQGENISFRGDSRIIDYKGNLMIAAGKEEKLISFAVDETQTIKKDLDDCEDIIFEINKHK